MPATVIRMIFFTLIALSLQSCKPTEWKWELVDAKGQPTPRHEASLVEHKGKLYLIGGRRINPTDVFDPKTQTWEQKSPTPLELHHFQAVSVGDLIYLIGAMTGEYPNEKPLDRVIVYNPQADKYEFTHTIPAERRRGGAGVVHHNGKLYIVGGITNGHVDGYQSWLDEYDPMSGNWRVLPDAAFARDHVQATVNNNKLYVFGGRTSRQRTEEVLSLTVKHGEVFDFSSEKWQPVTSELALPTLRAGNMVLSWGDEIIIGGGESGTQEVAHSEVEAYNVVSGQWRSWPTSLQGRHGSGFAVVGDYVYTASGAGNRGGGPELTTIERLKLPVKEVAEPAVAAEAIPVFQQWHKVELAFQGPSTSENAVENPFTDYVLEVEFQNADSKKIIRGFYAADGNAAETGADSGNVWKVRFAPDAIGQWQYRASLKRGSELAMQSSAQVVEEIPLSEPSGRFEVVRSDKDHRDFRALGLLGIDNGYFQFVESGQYWIKAGANSPENLLGYVGFDGTYRVSAADKEGEATAAKELHSYPNHLADWKLGDPSWQGGKGKSIIGAMNYLADKGMNADYFLTLNINGDGKDVWPYVNHEEFTRFDVSKLEQWEVLFAHMQSLGIMLHMVTQETENERLLDDGNVGPLRKLYYDELIARFSHHPALVWNLGEENGPADFSPVAQDDAQRKAMAAYLKKADPYGHPVLLHTHSTPESKDHILTPLLGDEALDGLSFQINLREQAHSEVIRWHEKSKAAGEKWLITMDEIGEWHTATLPDEMDPGHPTIRRYALWGTLMAGGAGVEWYFGARAPANDLTSEDWRLRDQLWTITNHARDFFQRYLPFWEMTPQDELSDEDGVYVFAKVNEVYVVYMPEGGETTLDLSAASGSFDVVWYDPIRGGQLQSGSVEQLQGGQVVALGSAPIAEKQDWVVMLRRAQSASATD